MRKLSQMILILIFGLPLLLGLMSTFGVFPESSGSNLNVSQPATVSNPGGGGLV